jgi:hemerythrin-like metal-binding protein
MLKVNWGPDLALGITVIDAQHHHFVDLLNQYYQAIENNQEKEVLAGFLENLSQYATEHFATEERYFAQFSFPGRVDHIKAHQDLMARLAIMIGSFEQGEVETVAMGLSNFLTDWLEHHLKEMDRLYVDCFHENGLK